MIVMKFGGSCLDKPSDIRRMVDIVRDAVADHQKIVQSAFKGMTDELIKQAISAREGSFNLEWIEGKHREFLSGLPVPVRTNTERHIETLLGDLRRTLEKVSADHNLTVERTDEIISYGERLAVQIVSGYLSAEHLDNSPLSDLEAGLITDSRFGDAMLLDESYQLVRDRIQTVQLPVIAGFFGKDKAGRIATLGRGGTDYVAAFVASALGCDCILLKDVEGIMSADPKLVPNARLLTEVDYPTAIELAHYGSKVVFEKAILPAFRNKTKIRVTSFLNTRPGTVIKADAESATAVSLLKNITILRISTPASFSITAFKQELESAHRDDLLAMADASGREVILAIRDENADAIAKIAGTMITDKVSLTGGRSLVAVTCSSVEPLRTRNILQKEYIEVDAVSLSPTGRSVCVVLDAANAEHAVRILHDNFIA
jgi:aspartate kinase